MKPAFTDLFIKKPVLAIVISALIVIAGLQAVRSLSIRQYPLNENAKITIQTAYIGADSKLVRGFITTPIEQAIATADGIDYITSESKLGSSTVVARLKLNYDSTKALSDISAKVDQVRGELPPEAEIPIITVASADSERASAYLSFSSTILPANQITDYLMRVIQPRLNTIDGIQEARILGGRYYAMRIWLDATKMAALNISPTEVNTALRNENYLSALGQTKGQLVTVNLTADSNLSSVSAFENINVKALDGRIIRLRDIAEIELAAQSYDTAVRFAGDQAVFIGLYVQPKANAVDAIAAVRKELVQIQSELPEGLVANIGYDSTVYIEESIQEVIHTLIETLLIVIFVIYLFMGRFRTILVPILTIPISLIGAAFFMQLLGFSINLLTLLAIVLSVGIVVDDAIIVVENIERHLSAGMRPFEAALTGVRELIGPVIATTLTLVAVYIPIAFQGGLTGSLFKEFALTLSAAVIVSSVVALVLSPMLASKLLVAREPSGLAKWINGKFERLQNTYARLVASTLNGRRWLVCCWLIIAVCCAPFFCCLQRNWRRMKIKV